MRSEQSREGATGNFGAAGLSEPNDQTTGLTIRLNAERVAAINIPEQAWPTHPRPLRPLNGK